MLLLTKNRNPKHRLRVFVYYYVDVLPCSAWILAAHRTRSCEKLVVADVVIIIVVVILVHSSDQPNQYVLDADGKTIPIEKYRRQLCVCECNSFCWGFFFSSPIFRIFDSTRLSMSLCLHLCVAFKSYSIDDNAQCSAHCISGMKMCLRVFIVTREECTACTLQLAIIITIIEMMIISREVCFDYLRCWIFYAFMRLCDLSYREKIFHSIRQTVGKENAFPCEKNIFIYSFRAFAMSRCDEQCVSISFHVWSKNRETDLNGKKLSYRRQIACANKLVLACVVPYSREQTNKRHRWQYNTIVDKTKVRKTN